MFILSTGAGTGDSRGRRTPRIIFTPGSLPPKILGTQNNSQSIFLCLKVCYEVVLVSLRLSVGLVILLMLYSLAPENAIQYLDLHVVTLKFGLLCLLSKLACMYRGFNLMRRRIYTNLQA